MTVLSCSHCGAPRDPRALRCAYCGSPFADAKPGVPQQDVDAEIATLIRKKKKIEAVKLYRTLHKVGLREAKDAIDELERRLRS